MIWYIFFLISKVLNPFNIDCQMWAAVAGHVKNKIQIPRRISSSAWINNKSPEKQNQVETTKPRGEKGERNDRNYSQTQRQQWRSCVSGSAAAPVGVSPQDLHYPHTQTPWKKKIPTTVKKVGQRSDREDSELRVRNWKQRGVFFILGLLFFFGLFVFFGIHVTALLKNASKQLQDSRDWMWAHKVVTVIQTSAVWTEGSRRLQRRLWNATAVPLNNKSVAESQSSLTESRNVAQRPRCCVKKLLVCGDVVCLFVFFGVFFFSCTSCLLKSPEKQRTDCCVIHACLHLGLLLQEELSHQPSARDNCKICEKFTIKDFLTCLLMVGSLAEG